MSVSVKDLAQYLNDSVSFDFSKETISSYNQIRRRYKDFYALENARAFRALLNDIIGVDDQLVDVFVDLQAADKGFRYFAEKKNRDNAIIAVAAFLGNNRFSYHMSDLGRVYFAVNTWLCFYGSTELSQQWTECPICASPVNNGVCSNAKCKAKAEDFLPMMIELQELVADGKKGKDITLPKYVKLIVAKAQFGVYKTQLTEIEDKRKKQAQAQEEKQKQADIALAEKELEKLIAKKKLEDGKDNPNYDTLLQLLASNKVVETALQYNDKEFNKKVDAYKADIQSAKSALTAKAEAKKQEGLAKEALKDFLMKKAELDNEITNKAGSLSLTKLQELFKATDASYLIVSAFNTRFPAMYSVPEKQAILGYATYTKPETVKIIKRKELDYRLDKAKDALVALVGELGNELEKCKNAKDGAEKLLDRFTNEIEKDPEFIDCREQASWDALYKQTVAPLKKAIDEEYAKQTGEKKKQFQQSVDELKKKVKAATPKNGKAKSFKKQLELIKSNKYFDSIKNSGEYKKEISKLEKQIDVLLEEESRFFAKRRIVRKVLAITITLLLVIGYSLFAYILPVTQLQFETKSLSKNNYVVTQIKEEKTEILEIEETLPHFFLQTNKKVVAVGEGAFQDNTYLKRCILPATVEEIQANAFNGCVNLNTVILQSNKPPKLDASSFENCNTVFLVPQESYTAYMQDEGWSAHKNRVFPNYGNVIGYGTVMFDSNGGTPVETIESIQLNTLAEELPSSTREGYVFQGWCYIDGQGNEVLVKNDEAVFQNCVKLVAIWKQGEYTVHFNVNDKEGSVITKQVVHGDEWGTLPVVNREGYTFDGWYLGGEKLSASAMVAVVSETEVNARWTANQYNVVFKYEGGTPLEEKKEVTFGSAYGELPEPTMYAYVFAGWLCEDEIVTEDTLVFVAKNHYLTAQWKPCEYTIRFETNGGTLESETIVCEYNKETILPLPTRTGYTFTHWEYEGAVYYAEDTVINLADCSTELVFTAYWQADENTLIFHANQGEGEMESITALTAEQITLPMNTFTRVGYTFVGWSLQQDGEVQYEDGCLYEMATQTHTLYACWQANFNTLVLYANNGSGEKREFSYATGEQVTLAKNEYTREGYQFAGWEAANEEGVIYADEAVFVMPADEVCYLIATWSPNENVLVFDLNGGEGVEVKQYFYSDQAKNLQICSYTRRGYSFAGWSETANGPVNYLDGAGYVMGVKAQVTLYAVWEINTYEITYEINGGETSAENSTEYNVHSTGLILRPIERKGYTFEGWYTDTAMTNQITEIDASLLTNICVYAKWKANINSLYFDGNGGVGEMSGKQMATDSEAGLPDCGFAKVGYQFVGWSTVKDGAVVYFAGSSYQMGYEAEYTLYAVWETVIYYVSYQTMGGVNNPQNPNEYHIESEEIILQAPSRAGYDFGGWYLEQTTTTTPVEKIEKGSIGNKVFYAKWTATRNTLHFDANGGVGSMDDLSLTTGETRALPISKFSNEGYNFAGWSLQQNGSSTYSDGASFEMGTEPLVTLYAVWTTFNYSISYNLAGGTNNLQNPSGYAIDSANIVLLAPTKAGSTFAGWYKDAAYTTQITEIPTGSNVHFILYAKWTLNTNTLHFNANGGTGNMADVKAKTGESITLPVNTFTRVGYTFRGWSTSKSGLLVYRDGGSYVMGTNAEVTLYALWRGNSYTVSYGGNSKTVTFGDTYGVLEAPAAKTGYTFVGWSYNGSTITENTVVATAGNHTLTPVWKANTYIVAAGGENKTVTYGQTYGTLPTPTKTGYTFVNWTYNGNVITANSVVTIAGNHTLTATWKVNYYTITVSESGADVKVTVGSVVYATETSISVAYGSAVTVSFSSTYSDYKDLSCTFDGVSITSGSTQTMPAKNITISASSTEVTESCFAKGTLITLPNGGTKRVEELKLGDSILSYDHATGTFVEREIGFIYYEFGRTLVTNLYFSDGSSLTVINMGHGLFDATLGRYVLVAADNVEQFVGDSFVVADSVSGTLKTVTLTAYHTYEGYTERYDLVTYGEFNCIANNFLVCSDILVNVCNTFDFTEDFVYDMEKMQQDLATYGVYTYEEWSGYLTEEEFLAFKGSYFKVAVEKGLISQEEILHLLWYLHSWN